MQAITDKYLRNSYRFMYFHEIFFINFLFKYFPQTTHKYFPISLVSNVVGVLLWPIIDQPLEKLSRDAVT